MRLIAPVLVALLVLGWPMAGEPDDFGVTGDARTVGEPSFPASMCSTLVAQQSEALLDQGRFDTGRLQAAIDSCPRGQAVHLVANNADNAFLTQPIALDPGVTLLLDPEVTLFGSTNKSDYNCDSAANWCTPLITVASSNEAAGEGSAIMGYGIIDGQGATWWPDGDPRPRLVQLGDHNSNTHADNFTVYKITLRNSPKMNLMGIGDHVTVWGVKISNPPDSPNTDGIDPSASSNWTITRSYISDGDDQIAIKAGVGHVSNITISHNHLYTGHGISIGSETNAGVDNILVTDNVIDQAGCAGCGSSNDIRIKSDVSRGGEVENVLYRDLCIRNAPGTTHAFVFDPAYDSNASGSLVPFMHDIHLQNINVVNAGAPNTFVGLDSDHALTLTVDNVVPDLPRSSDRAENVQFTASDSSAPPYDCSEKFTQLAADLTSTQPRSVIAILDNVVQLAPPPTGTITLLENGKTLASAPVAGRLTQINLQTVASGPHTLTAHYSGDQTYAPLDFGSLTLQTR